LQVLLSAFEWRQQPEQIPVSDASSQLKRRVAAAIFSAAPGPGQLLDARILC
jgi:hypothetical protein